MKTLKAHYDEIIYKNDKWWYYKTKPVIETKDILTKNIAAKNFIKNYFDIAGKQDVLGKDLTELENLIQRDEKGLHRYRFPHINSVFFLGLSLEKIIPCKASVEPSDIRYLLFLMVLYHDVGYLYEEEGATNRYDIEASELLTTNENLIFSSTTIRKYLKYRNNKEHGIAGGCILYDRLISNVEKHYKLAVASGLNIDKNKFVFNDLLWGEFQYPTFQKISMAVACHNIWFPCPADKEKYIELELQEIIKKQRHRYSDNPLFFLLVLADTIEPIKRLGPECLDYISLSLKPNEIKIFITPKYDSRMTDDDDFKKWSKAIIGLKDWMDIDAKKTNNTILISNWDK